MDLSCSSDPNRSGAGEGSEEQRQISPHSGQFMQSSLQKMEKVHAKADNWEVTNGILALFATLPLPRPRAKFTMPLHLSPKG